MDHARFWSFIDEARRSRGRTAAALIQALAKLPAAEIVAFDAWFWAYYLATSREDLWAAVFAIRGGCGDDSFDYFRGWLISQGEAAVLAAIRDPESLVELIGDADPSDEHMLGVAREAYHEVSAGELPDSESVEIPGRDTWPADRFESGLKWNAAFYEAHFPTLHARYFANAEPEPTGAISYARFWEIVSQAHGNDIDQVMLDLRGKLRQLSREELIGFERWLSTYNQALMRHELRVVCRVLLGKDDAETVAGFRGWLIAQGERAVHAATHDPDSILEHAKQPPRACFEIILVTWDPLRMVGVFSRVSDEEYEVIPDRNTWRADWDVKAPSVAQLRERFPRLTAGLSDEQLGGPVDISRLSSYERQRMAGDLLVRARAITDDRAKLVELDLAAQLWPQHEEIRGLRGRVHARLGNLAAARADFDAALAHSPHAVFVQWERSKLRLSTGDREGAIADARAVADRVDDARLWLTTLTPGTPKRVRHAKFGEGTVVSADRTGSEPKLVIDFSIGRKTIATRFVDVIE